MTTENNTDTNNSVGLALVTLAAIPVGIPVEGWCLAKLWAWFVVPLGAHPLAMWHASGLSLLISYVMMRPREPRNRPWSVLADMMWSPILVGAPFVMVAGYIVHRLMVG